MKDNALFFRACETVSATAQGAEVTYHALGLKSLTATCYAASPFAQLELDLFGGNFNAQAPSRKEGRQKQPYKIVINEVTDVNGDGRVDLADVEWLLKNDQNVLTRLEGDGDFRSSESIALINHLTAVPLWRSIDVCGMAHGALLRSCRHGRR